MAATPFAGVVRLLADDLTGALDSAAGFVPLAGPLRVMLSGEGGSGSFAIDADTRELSGSEAAARVAELVPLLAEGDLAFKKIDSLLRGHVAAELAACAGRFDHCVLAPAFPFQGRITRGGRQLVRGAEGWRDAGVDLPARLHALGLRISVRDAETDADLAAIVTEGRRHGGRVLWCGTRGLAAALAGGGAVPTPPLPRPMLALIGSGHPVSVGQLAAVPCLHRMVTPDAAAIAALRRSLDAGAAAVCVPQPAETPHAEALQRITAGFAEVLARTGRPGTLIVSGGETLRALCGALGVSCIEVDGEVMPGVPTSRLRGGAWDGQRLVSKSGAFGDPGFLARLLGMEGDGTREGGVDSAGGVG